MNPQSIWNEAQNKPTLVVRDLAEYAPADVVYESLLRRGVFKWLSVRRGLIKLKNTWRDRVSWSIQEQKSPDKKRHKEWLRGYRAGIEECREEVRALCHSSRWQAPDIDSDASRWLSLRERVEEIPR